MKKLISFLVLLMIVPITHANLNEWNIEISLNEDKTTQWQVSLLYNENVTRSDYFVLAKITGVEVMADDKFVDCIVSRKEVGTSILCENIHAERVVYRFRAIDMISDFNNNYLKDFKYRFSITQITEKFYLVIKLPLGAGLVEESKLGETGLKTFEPSWGKEGSDGRKIFITWELENPKIGTGIDARIIYEQLFEFSLFPVIIIFALIAILLVVLFFFRRKTIKDMLPVLNEGERKIMEILLKERKGVDQRIIVKEMDYSKAKVSRIIQNLGDRGLIEKIRKGRSNVIKYKKIERENIEKKS
ncbi:MAG: hypothetical protein V1900_02110 [Candidatus Aenigmatarchaeota archaeon]